MNKITEAKLTLDIALNLSGEILDDREKSEALISIINIKAVSNDRIVRTTETILTDRGKYLSEIAKILIAIQDLDNFKKLLIPCSYYLESAFIMCESLVQLYPNQSQSVLKIIEESEFLFSYASSIVDSNNSKKFEIYNTKVSSKISLR